MTGESGKPVERAFMARERVIALTDSMMDPMEERFPDSFNRQSTRIFFALRAIAQQINDEASVWLAPFGLNASTYNYLVNLFAAPNHTMTQNEIRLFMHTSHATVAQMVRSMERDGWVKRIKNPSDARSMMVKITAKGMRVVKAAAPLHHAELEDRMKFLTRSDRGTLTSLLLLVNRGFEEGREAASGRPPKVRISPNGHPRRKALP